MPNTSTGFNFLGQPFPNFSVRNDRVFDNLRVRMPNTFKAPPAGPQLINPNIPDPAVADPVFPSDFYGSNDPDTNPTLTNGVAQAGALVYSTTPILNSGGTGPATDGCFDGRNHLYFSDGSQWIPLANCLPRDAKDLVCDGPQYAEAYDDPTFSPITITDNWQVVPLDNSQLSSNCFEVDVKENEITYTGEAPIVAKVVVSASWDLTGNVNNNQTLFLGVGIGGADPADNLIQKGYDLLNKPRNVTISGLVSLDGDPKTLTVQIKRSSSGGDPDMEFKYLNISVMRVGA